ncbi:hypothetical protein AB837_00110 [bacterium AB1]|nr:hypothetical protein AB837_00110 [bacterium AB1]
MSHFEKNQELFNSTERKSIDIQTDNIIIPTKDKKKEVKPIKPRVIYACNSDNNGERTPNARFNSEAYMKANVMLLKKTFDLGRCVQKYPCKEIDKTYIPEEEVLGFKIDRRQLTSKLTHLLSTCFDLVYVQSAGVNKLLDRIISRSVVDMQNGLALLSSDNSYYRLLPSETCTAIKAFMKLLTNALFISYGYSLETGVLQKYEENLKVANSISAFRKVWRDMYKEILPKLRILYEHNTPKHSKEFAHYLYSDNLSSKEVHDYRASYDLVKDQSVCVYDKDSLIRVIMAFNTLDKMLSHLEAFDNFFDKEKSTQQYNVDKFYDDIKHAANFLVTLMISNNLLDVPNNTEDKIAHTYYFSNAISQMLFSHMSRIPGHSSEIVSKLSALINSQIKNKTRIAAHMDGNDADILHDHFFQVEIVPSIAYLLLEHMRDNQEKILSEYLKNGQINISLGSKLEGRLKSLFGNKANKYMQTSKKLLNIMISSLLTILKDDKGQVVKNFSYETLSSNTSALSKYSSTNLQKHLSLSKEVKKFSSCYLFFFMSALDKLDETDVKISHLQF